MNAKVIFDLITNTVQYSAGDLIGSAVSVATSNFQSGSDQSIKGITVEDLAKQNTPLSFIFFDSTPDATTFTNNSALDIGDSDVHKIFAVVSMSHTNYQGFADNSVGTVQCDIPVSTSAVGGLFMAVVTNGSPTYASVSDLKVSLLLD